MSTTVWGRIVDRIWANRPGGKPSRGRNVHDWGRNVQGKKRQSGETSINCRRISRRPETKQGIGGKIVRFRPGRVRDRVRVRDKER